MQVRRMVKQGKKMYAIFFILIWCLCIQPSLMQSPGWDLVAPLPIVFGQQLELSCTVIGGPSCCNFLTREWNKGPTSIMTNGLSTVASKYIEKIDAANNRFSLLITKLDKNDVDVGYTCTYGNTSPLKTLTHNDSFEYHPTESCAVTLDEGELVVTLKVAMSAPYPSVSAQYGGKNLTSLVTTIVPVTGSPKFYTITISGKTKATCGNDEMLTLSVLTGVTTTNICNNVDLCKCGECAGKCFGWAVLGTIVTAIVVFIVLFRIRYWADNPESVFGNKGSTFTIKCPFNNSERRVRSWQRVYPDRVTQLTDGDKISINGQFNLQIRQLEESDEGLYRCSDGKSLKVYKLVVLDSTVFGKEGSTITLQCPFNNPKESVRWQRVYPDTVTQITDGDFISKTQMQQRISINRKFNLQIRLLEESDEGMYRCSVGLQELFYKLEILDKKKNAPSCDKMKNAPSCVLAILTKKQKILAVVVTILISVVVDVAVAVPICYKKCICINNTDPAFIALGVGTCAITAVIVLCIVIGYYVTVVNGTKGTTIILECPFNNLTEWLCVFANTFYKITDGEDIAVPLMQHRLVIEKQFNLEIRQLEEWDEGLYICSDGNQEKFYKLVVLDKNGNQNHGGRVENAVLFDGNAAISAGD